MLLAGLLAPVPAAGRDGRPSIVFVLLDTTRADRLGAWGHTRPTSPALDGLAAGGVRFAWHFANSHATRPSMPQLMSGRYYHQNILRTFEPLKHPREFPFSRPARRAALLPGILRAAGYGLVGVSAHPWVVAESEFGRAFDRLELVPFDAKAGHGDATVVIDRALTAWDARPRDRPSFLYLHLMDAHMPRTPPAAGVGFDIPPAAGRFDAGSEPLFGPERRRWSRTDASDYTAADRAHFAAVYDACVAHADAQLARLLERLRRDDPALARTLVVVTSDHGEELGEDSRVDHGDALADGVQHVPWVMAGAGIVPGQVAAHPTEHVDVLPTVLVAAGLALPPNVRTDGVPRLEQDGRLRAAPPNGAVHFAWEDYHAVRTGEHLLRAAPLPSGDAHCRGEPALYPARGTRRVPIEAPPRAVVDGLQRRLAGRLHARARRFRAQRYDAPDTPFSFGPAFWAIAPSDAVRCVPVSPDVARAALDDAGWMWTGRGLALLAPADDTPPLALAVDAPDGEYAAEVGVVPVPPRPWLWGFERWLRRAFRSRAQQWVDVGAASVRDGLVTVTVPAAVGAGRHVVALRLTPPDASPPVPAPPPDAEQQERLRALGYLH